MFQEFGPAFGARVRTLREGAGVTQDALARAVSRSGTGVRWTQSRVGQVEAGDAAPDLAALCAVALALRSLTGEPVRLTDLLPPEAPDAGVQAVRNALAGEPVQFTPASGVSDARLDPGWGPVEDKALAAVGADPAEVLAVARGLYAGRTGTQERDLRAGAGATPQRRGRVTRTLVEELIAALPAAK